MEETSPQAQPATSRTLTERQAQQRAAVLAVIGSEAGEDVGLPAAADVPAATADVAPESAAAIDEVPEPAAPAEPVPTDMSVETPVSVVPSDPVVELPPPAPVPAAEPAAPAPLPKPRRHWLSKFVHRRATERRQVSELRVSHPVVAHRRHYLRWLLALLGVAAVTPAVAWFAIYRMGADGPAAQSVASLVPLPAGRVGAATLTLGQLYSRVAWHPKLNASPLAAVTPVAEGDKRAAFQAWVDEQLIRSELVSRGQAVTASQLTRELEMIQRGLGKGADLDAWTQATYGLPASEFREYILRPTVERNRLATILVADRQRYVQAWEQAGAASRVRGLVGMSDLGWVDSLDVGPTVADVLAATSRDTRTPPVPVAAGLAVYRFSETATDEHGATFWHLWQLTFPVPAVDDFLAQARASADEVYYLP